MSKNRRGADGGRARPLLTVIMSLVLFLGTGLTIAYFNNDVGMAGVMESLCGFLSGGEASMPIAAVCYSLGVGVGVLLFFRPPLRDGKRDPLQVKYDKSSGGEGKG